MARWAQGIFVPKSPEKYIGKNKPKYRSGWELTFMTFCDSNKNVLYWASESFAIPYRSPLDGKIHQYIPDFFVVYENKSHQIKAEIVEVKPKSQTSLTEAKTRHDKLHAIVNQAKFLSATAYCKQHGYVFRVISEDSIFANTTSSVKKRR